MNGRETPRAIIFEQRLAEAERLSRLANKRVEDMRWVIGICIAFMTVLFTLTNISLYSDKKDIDSKVQAQREKNDQELDRRIGEMNAALTTAYDRFRADAKDRNDKADKDINREADNVRALGRDEETRVENSLYRFKEELLEKRLGSPKIEVFGLPPHFREPPKPLKDQEITASIGYNKKGKYVLHLEFILKNTGTAPSGTLTFKLYSNDPITLQSHASDLQESFDYETVIRFEPENYTEMPGGASSVWDLDFGLHEDNKIATPLKNKQPVLLMVYYAGGETAVPFFLK